MAEIREKVYHIRLSDSEAARLEALTKDYDFRFAADLIRQAVSHVDRTRPTLGVQFTPKSKAKNTQQGKVA